VAGRVFTLNATADGTMTTSIERLLYKGSIFNDTVTGGTGDDTLHGSYGDDQLYGASGVDSLYVEDDADHLYGQDGNDHLYGGAGVDVLYGDDTIHGGTNGVTDNSKNTLFGGDGNDHLYGDAGTDTIMGDAGDDFIFGQGGNDTFYGGDGNDQLNGGTGTGADTGGHGFQASARVRQPYAVAALHNRPPLCNGTGLIGGRLGIVTADAGPLRHPLIWLVEPDGSKRRADAEAVCGALTRLASGGAIQADGCCHRQRAQQSD
jgi:hypothetical protein